MPFFETADVKHREQDMERAFGSYRVGAATITKIPELALDGVDPTLLYPDYDPAAGADEARRLGPGSVDRHTGLLRQSIHAWLVTTPDRVILVDTGSGNDKERPGLAVLHHLNEPFLERLEAAGVRADDVDLVLLTHIHADHVGWNTSWTGEHWVPTFPNARHVFSARERAYNAALAAATGSDMDLRAEAGLGPMARLPLPGVYEDSVVPIVEAGLAREITVDGSQAEEGFFFLPSPGHSIDHASIGFRSEGEYALFWGDVLHHPLQIARPDWNSAYCEFPQAATASRHWALNHAAETGALVLTTHFAETSAGRVRRDGNAFSWQFV